MAHKTDVVSNLETDQCLFPIGFYREWQMERAFQTALWLLQPEVVFILGDIFDEGKWSSSQVGPCNPSTLIPLSGSCMVVQRIHEAISARVGSFA